jgi:hypothetical protein
MKYVVDTIGGPTGGDAWQVAVTAAYFPLDTEYRSRPEFRGCCATASITAVTAGTS